jgi:hypothetical protein
MSYSDSFSDLQLPSCTPDNTNAVQHGSGLLSTIMDAIPRTDAGRVIDVLPPNKCYVLEDNNEKYYFNEIRYVGNDKYYVSNIGSDEASIPLFSVTADKIKSDNNDSDYCTRLVKEAKDTAYIREKIDVKSPNKCYILGPENKKLYFDKILYTGDGKYSIHTNTNNQVAKDISMYDIKTDKGDNYCFNLALDARDGNKHMLSQLGGTSYYHKYLKYKQKYLNLKNR